MHVILYTESKTRTTLKSPLWNSGDYTVDVVCDDDVDGDYRTGVARVVINLDNENAVIYDANGTKTTTDVTTKDADGNCRTTTSVEGEITNKEIGATYTASFGIAVPIPHDCELSPELLLQTDAAQPCDGHVRGLEGLTVKCTLAPPDKPYDEDKDAWEKYWDTSYGEISLPYINLSEYSYSDAPLELSPTLVGTATYHGVYITTGYYKHESAILKPTDCVNTDVYTVHYETAEPTVPETTAFPSLTAHIRKRLRRIYVRVEVLDEEGDYNYEFYAYAKVSRSSVTRNESCEDDDNRPLVCTHTYDAEEICLASGWGLQLENCDYRSPVHLWTRAGDDCLCEKPGCDCVDFLEFMEFEGWYGVSTDDYYPTDTILVSDQQTCEFMPNSEWCKGAQYITLTARYRVRHRTGILTTDSGSNIISAVDAYGNECPVLLDTYDNSFNSVTNTYCEMPVPEDMECLNDRYQ